MTPDEARALLAIHSGSHPDADDPRLANGFLDRLRPYRGLREESFHEIMACIAALADELAGDRLDRATVSALWDICFLARLWGVDEGGMLRRNGLISADDVKRLAAWLECISFAVMKLLAGVSVDTALADYRARHDKT